MNFPRITLLATLLAGLAGCPTAPPGTSPDAGEDTSTPGDAETDDGAPDDMRPDEGEACGGCSGATPVCDTTSDTCVECLQTSDCDTGVCDTDTNTCVECLGDDDCTAGVCDTGAHACVDCLANQDCTDPTASTCDADTNTCTGCTASTDCSHLADTTVCDTDEGTCVECTGTEYDACDGVCDSRENTCTDRPAGELGLCEACVSDAECREGMVCVAQMFEAADMSGPAEVGTFCFWERDATVNDAPDGSCFSIPPYVDDQAVTSLDGVQTNVCGLRATTCPGFNDFDTECATAGEDDLCGAEGFDDGFCVAADPQTNLCTVPCVGSNDCRLDCDTSIEPPRCEL